MDDNEIWCTDCNILLHIGEEHECFISSNNNVCENDYIEKLIAEVFVRETLWNSSLPYQFRGPTITKALWTEIDALLGTVAGTSQKKWKNLRDRFVKKHALQTAYIPSGSAAIKSRRTTWPLYETLRFLILTVNYRKTQSNLENPDIQSLPGKSNLITSCNTREEINTMQHNQYLAVESQQTQHIIELNSQAVQSQQNYRSLLSPSTSDSTSSDLSLTVRRPSERNISAKGKLNIASYTEESFGSLLCSKSGKKLKPAENVNTPFEEAILKELKQTKSTKENLKPDKIESFIKYLEACLRSMTSDVSKHTMKKILEILLFEEDK